MTPGPWTYKQVYNGGAGSIVGPDGRGVACISGAIKRPKEENLANAKVLAAAPQLAKVLCRLLAAVDAEAEPAELNDASDAARAALKAAGVTP